MGAEQIAQRGDQALVKAVELGLQNGRRPPGQRRPGLQDRDRIDVHAHHRRSQADGLVQRRAAAHHRIENDLTSQPAGAIIIPRLGIIDQTLQDEPEGAAATTAPPLMQIGVRPVVMLVVRFIARQAIGKGGIKRRVDGQPLVRGDHSDYCMSNWFAGNHNMGRFHARQAKIQQV